MTKKVWSPLRHKDASKARLDPAPCNTEMVNHLLKRLGGP